MRNRSHPWIIGSRFPEIWGKHEKIKNPALCHYHCRAAVRFACRHGAGPAEPDGGQGQLQYAMQVLEEMKKNHRIDEKRIYLTGHSMGAIGTWYLAAKYPDIWAAIAPFSGYGLPANVAKMKGLPAIVIHGDADPTVPVAGSRLMVEALKKLGVDHRYIEVPGGNHMNVVQPNFAAVFEFFNQHRK